MMMIMNNINNDEDDDEYTEEELNLYSKALLVACNKKKDLDLAILLINKGSNINHQEEDKNEYGEKMVKTPLTICC